MTRTQDEIVERFRAVADDDLFGFRREVLADALDLEHLRIVLPGAAPDDDFAPLTPDALSVNAGAYLEFAIGKTRDHRGISASRSVDKLREYAWLLGRDDVVSAMDSARYAQYGAPKVRAFALGMNWPWPDAPDLARMALSLPCRDGCESGCDT